MRRVRRIHPSRSKAERITARQWRRILKTGHRPRPFPRPSVITLEATR